MRRGTKALVMLLCAGSLWGGVPVAQAAPPEPDSIFLPDTTKGPDLVGPCGLAINGVGQFYVSNYYSHSIDARSGAFLSSVIASVDPLDGPCGLSLDNLNRIYVNNYHRNVERYTLSGGTIQTPVVVDTSHPTGVAVDPGTNGIYVNSRTHLRAYDSSGTPLLDGPDPLKIGVGSLGDGYSLAVSQFPATMGRLYVPDHVDDTVKVYDPLLDKDNPVQVITGPPGGFGSLRDSAIAVDRVTGEIYVADTRAHPVYTERPEVTIHVFEATGTYKGRLKYNVIDGSPVGLAVDNTLGASQSRVYVTSGNTYGASIYIYPPGSATNVSAPPLGVTGKVGDSSQPDPAQTSVAEGAGVTGSSARSLSATASVIAQKGTLRVTVEGKLAPKRLPRQGTAPIAVTVGGKITTTDKSMPPQLEKIQIELNKGGKLDTKGLPPCSYSAIQPGSSERALSACKDSLVGKGSFNADITLAGQEAYPTGGKMLLFHSVERGKPVLYGHIYSPKPFATSFVIVFKVQKISKGKYGIALNAPLPPAMDAWGRLTGLQMTLQRRYTHNGTAHSFISAGCPAPAGFTAADFPLARTEFSFEGGKVLRSTLMSRCKVRG